MKVDDVRSALEALKFRGDNMRRWLGCEDRKSGTACKALFLALVLLVVLGIVLLGYLSQSELYDLARWRPSSGPHEGEAYALPRRGGTASWPPAPGDAGPRRYSLDLEAEDVVVFLHIQKTGGSTFGKHLVRHLKVEPPCTCFRGRKRCSCRTKSNTIWLFSRYSTGWICGLHADWTEMKNCVDDVLNEKEGRKRPRNYHYVTILRNPVQRYISEWKHVQRGATWKAALLKCNGRQATLKEVPFCFSEENWKDVTLNDFMMCKHNLAPNRQVRMLANLSRVNCYNTTGMTSRERDAELLKSAMENLKNMSYFGLTEYQHFSQVLFEDTFGLRFSENFVQFSSTHSSQVNVSKLQMVKIMELNKLDILLYRFAKDLFLRRVGQLKNASGLQKVGGGPDDLSDDYNEMSDENQNFSGKRLG